jgi:excisionase family DNA binding protein
MSEAAPVTEPSKGCAKLALTRAEAAPLASFSTEAVDALIEHVVECVLERLGRENGSPWLTRAQAASYLSLPVSRLEKDRRIPCHREGRRVLYHRDELDQWMLDV